MMIIDISFPSNLRKGTRFALTAVSAGERRFYPWLTDSTVLTYVGHHQRGRDMWNCEDDRGRTAYLHHISVRLESGEILHSHKIEDPDRPDGITTSAQLWP